MATYATQSIPTSGLEATYTAVSASDNFVPADGSFLHVKNGGGSDCTVTITTPGTVDGLAVGDRTVTVTAGEDRFIQIPPNLYRGSNGLGTVGYSPTTSVTAAVLRA